MFDHTDIEILKCLKENSRLQWKEIGEKVHMTGQAVSARVDRMKELGIIKYFTVEVDYAKLGMTVLAFITVFMKSNDHRAFQDFLKSTEGVLEVHRISGDGCYWIKAHMASQNELNKLLDGVLRYGNYRLSISIGEIRVKSEVD